MMKDKMLGKKIFFENDGSDFDAIHKAKYRLKDNGYSYGSMQRDARIGIKKGDFIILKRRNLSKEDIDELDGYIYQDGGYRNGKVGIVFFDTPSK